MLLLNRLRKVWPVSRIKKVKVHIIVKFNPLSWTCTYSAEHTIVLAFFKSCEFLKSCYVTHLFFEPALCFLVKKANDSLKGLGFLTELKSAVKTIAIMHIGPSNTLELDISDHDSAHESVGKLSLDPMSIFKLQHHISHKPSLSTIQADCCLHL